MIAQLTTFNGQQPAHTRIRNVQPSSFEIHVEEWGYLNGMHAAETITYLVIEKGQYTLPRGQNISAGSVDTDHSWITAALGGGFTANPVVLSHCQTSTGGQAVVTRQRNVGTATFDVRLQEEEGNDGVHLVETIGWVAIAT